MSTRVEKNAPFESGSSDEGGAVGYTSPPSFAPAAATSSFTPSEEWVSIGDVDDDDDDDVVITGVKKRK